MLTIQTLTLGLYQTNCYILHDNSCQRCCVIDPGYDPDTVLTHLKQQGLTLEAILLTHGHFDHVGAVKELAVQTDCRVFLCPQELSLPAMITAGSLFYTDTYGEGDILELAGLSIRVLATPGHTPGSVCLLTGDALFSGDTLFAGSCGRTDLPGGDWATIRRSLKRLSEMALSCRVFPGHGESTTLDAEKLYNPYLR